METGQGATETAAFTQALASLKRRGSNLLLVGAANDHAHVDACRRLLGDDGPTRRRLFVLTDRDHSAVPSARDDVAVVEYESMTRSAASAQDGAAGGLGPAERVVTLDGLGDAARSAIESFDRDAGGLSPAELRLCFDSLRPLLEEHSEQRVFRFLHALTGDVRDVSGMAHFHLPVAYDDPTVRTIAPLFDAVVEVRAAGGEPQQRWHLREEDISTEWLPL